ncbi:MAG: galactokinase [Bacteroidota bacterium]|jgi:galactokinase
MFPQTVIEQFKAVFGEEQEIVVRAPGRINLIGEHTDYNSGYVLPAAIDKAIWFAASKRNDDRFIIHSLDLNDSFDSKEGEIRQQSQQSWVNYLLGVVSEARKDGFKVGGLNIVFGGNVPLGAGLSSSAALECGMGHIVNELFSIGMDKMDIVKLAQRAENKFVGMQCGIMDMFASVMGRCENVVRLDCRSLEYEYFPFKSSEYTLILCNSGVKHALVDSEYNTRRRECETGVAQIKMSYPDIRSLRDITPSMLEQEKSNLSEVVYRRCNYVIGEIERVEDACEALINNDLVQFGSLMYQTHDGLQHDYEVSCTELDFLVDMTKQFNTVMNQKDAVLGARMMGGGFGGCSINLVKKSALKSFLSFMQTAFQAEYNRELPCHEVALTDGVATIYPKEN